MSSSFPSCIIGLELSDERVRWVLYQTDARFEIIVPILRTYTNQYDVKKLLDLGFQNGLPMTAQQLPEIVDRYETEQPSEVADDRYELEFYAKQSSNPVYHYIFTQDNKWICTAPSFFEMDNLK